MRSAIIGASAAALDAGTTEATNAANASAAAATLNATGSQNDTPYSCADSRYPAPTARGAPSTSPMADTLERPAQHHADHAAAIGAERHAQADLAPAARHGIRRDAVEADRGEDQRNDAEQAGEAGDGALLVEGPRHLFLERADVDHGQVGIRLGERARHEWLQRALRRVGHQQNAADVVRGRLHALHQRARRSFTVCASDTKNIGRAGRFS